MSQIIKNHERKQTSKMKMLLEEYRSLRDKLFQGLPFAEQIDGCPEWDRYNQLFCYFYPQYRTKEWIEPEPMQEINQVN